MTRTMAGPAPDVTLADPPRGPANPWNALWTLMVGYFMIPVDASARRRRRPDNPGQAETPDYDMVIWLTSAYLLAYAVPLLMAGRLGDRFGLKNLYLIGLAVFTAGLVVVRPVRASIEMLIAARVVQGIGADVADPADLVADHPDFPA